MKQRRLLFVVLSGILLTSFSESNFAGNRAGAFTITPALGYYGFASKRHLTSSSLPLIEFAYNVDQSWALDVSLGKFHTGGKDEFHGQRFSENLYLVDALYRFTPRNIFEPYVIFGMGALTTNPSPHDARTLANANIGLGAEIFASDSIAFAFEVRDLYTFSGGKNEGLVNLGVSFLFGKSAS